MTTPHEINATNRTFWSRVTYDGTAKAIAPPPKLIPTPRLADGWWMNSQRSLGK
jgi:hypothetical protein